MKTTHFTKFSVVLLGEGYENDNSILCKVIIVKKEILYVTGAEQGGDLHLLL